MGLFQPPEINGETKYRYMRSGGLAFFVAGLISLYWLVTITRTDDVVRWTANLLFFLWGLCGLAVAIYGHLKLRRRRG